MLTTEWGEALDRSAPLPEYPRPQLVRDSYINLNGPWEYAFTGDMRVPSEFEGEIVVPFAPESALSGVGRTLRGGEYLWYRRKLVRGGLQPRAGAAALRLRWTRPPASG